jgi:type I restriction enzyme, S subunit
MLPSDLSAGDDIILTTTTALNTLPPEWALTTVGEHFDLQQGKALSPAARKGRSYRPFLRTSNVLWGRLDLATVDQMDFTDDEASRLALRSGDLLVCEGGEVGRTAVWDQEIHNCLFQNHLHRLRAKTPHVYPEFVMYWMQAALLHLALYGGIANKTTIPNLSGGRLKRLPIPLPELKEQQAIAHVLSRIRAAIQVHDMTIVKLKELKAATVAKLFREGLNGEPLKQTEIGEIPKNWDVVKLGSPDFATTASGGTPPRSRAEFFGGAIPWVKSGELKDDMIVRTEETLSELGLAASSAKILSKGTLLLAMYGATAGMTGILGMSATTNQAVCALLPTRESFSSYFLQHYLVLRRDKILSERHGGAQPNISQAIVRQLLVPKAPLTEQVQIGNILSSLSDRLGVCAAKANLIRSLFASMLQSVMTGQVRVLATK